LPPPVHQKPLEPVLAGTPATRVSNAIAALVAEPVFLEITL